MCLLTAGTHILPWNYGVMYLSPNPKQLFKLKCIVCSTFWKANILKVELSMIKIGELLRKLWSLRSCFNILPPGALTPQGIEDAMKRDVNKHWCTLQWCASRGWFIAHDNWTSCWGIGGWLTWNERDVSRWPWPWLWPIGNHGGVGGCTT